MWKWLWPNKEWIEDFDRAVENSHQRTGASLTKFEWRRFYLIWGPLTSTEFLWSCKRYKSSVTRLTDWTGRWSSLCLYYRPVWQCGVRCCFSLSSLSLSSFTRVGIFRRLPCFLETDADGGGGGGGGLEPKRPRWLAHKAESVGWPWRGTVLNSCAYSIVGRRPYRACVTSCSFSRRQLPLLQWCQPLPSDFPLTAWPWVYQTSYDRMIAKPHCTSPSEGGK